MLSIDERVSARAKRTINANGGMRIRLIWNPKWFCPFLSFLFTVLVKPTLRNGKKGYGHAHHNRQFFTWFGTENILWGINKRYASSVKKQNRSIPNFFRFISHFMQETIGWILSKNIFFCLLSFHFSPIVSASFRRTFKCSAIIQAYKLGMYGADYVWILHEIVGEPWWHKTTHECNQKQLEEVSENLLIVSSHNSIVSNEISYSGLVSIYQYASSHSDMNI